MDITTRYLELMASKAKVYPQHVNRASNLGHPCLRYLVYCRLDWAAKKPPDPTLQSIFGLGHDWERLANERLTEMGYRIFEQQMALEFPAESVSGHLDLTVTHPDWPGYPDLLHIADNKSCSPHVWAKLRGPEDVVNSEHFYMRNYVAQLQLYLLLRAETEEQRGVLFFWSKTTAVPKEVWFSLDLEFAESLLQKARVINDHVERKRYPDRIEYSKDTCARCDFRATCLPDLSDAVALVQINDKDLEKKLCDRGECEQEGKKFNALDAEIKAALKARYSEGETKLVLGDWLIEGKQDSRGSWRTSIQRLDGSDDEG
jgi:hypothetical protein